MSPYHYRPSPRSILLAVLGTVFAIAMIIVGALSAHAADTAGSGGSSSGASALNLMQLVPWALSLVGGFTTLWRHRKYSTTRKVLESVVLGVEAAGRMPTVAGSDRTIKRAIQVRAVAAGVEPILREVVRTIAEPTVQAEEDAKFEETGMASRESDDAAGADRP